MAAPATMREVFDSILAGTSALEVLPRLATLERDDRQTVLCTACVMRGDIAENSEAHATSLAGVLSKACPLFVEGKPACAGRPMSV
ncbi:MAG TPA: hypothetical protein VKR43_10765 [Bryobacteraceae bacterium]|nr:hypothetical protein [Bryobacteraceae bacterium]